VYYVGPGAGEVCTRLSTLLGVVSTAIGESFFDPGHVVLVSCMVGYCDRRQRLYQKSLRLVGICGMS
jgi:hypothetical protein